MDRSGAGARFSCVFCGGCFTAWPRPRGWSSQGVVLSSALFSTLMSAQGRPSLFSLARNHDQFLAWNKQFVEPCNSVQKRAGGRLKRSLNATTQRQRHFLVAMAFFHHLLLPQTPWRTVKLGLWHWHFMPPQLSLCSHSHNDFLGVRHSRAECSCRCFLILVTLTSWTEFSLS